MESGITEIDIVILSFAQTGELKQITVNCLNSLMASEDPELIKFNIIVIEFRKDLAPFQYEYGQTVYSDKPFGYNRYMNIGISMTSASYVCLCNNDHLDHTTINRQETGRYDELTSKQRIYYEKKMGSPFRSQLGSTVNI